MTTHHPPRRTAYDVVIVGGGMHGSATAWFTASDPDFDGTILVVERDPTYAQAATTHTNSCIRQQFTNPVNVAVSQYAADFIRTMPERFAGPCEARDERVPRTAIHAFGYMYLAATPEAAAALKEAQALQAAAGAGTRHMDPDEIARLYPFYQLDDVVAANHNTRDEGYFDGGTLFDWWRRSARERGVEFCANKVTGLEMEGDARVAAVRLATGERITCGTVVNAAGPRAARVAAMAGVALPVEPRRRYTYVFEAERPLSRDLPLTIDPSGVHVRTDGALYMAGCGPHLDPAVADEAVEPDDFAEDHDLWQDHVWPALAHRVPAFEAIRLRRSWVGHYDMNTFDANAVLGPHPRITNMLFQNGFSGHGLQQSPAMGRGMAELIVHGEYRTLDLSEFGYARLDRGERFVEGAVI